MKRANNRRRGPAVLRFFIYLLLVILVCAVGMLVLGRGRNAGTRPYVVTGTCVPGTYRPSLPPDAEPTEAPPTPEPTPTPSPTPSPTPTPEPTPEPTPIPESTFARMVKPGKKLPAVSNDGNVGISACYVSAPDGYGVMELTGWGYANLDYFDGRQCGTYLVVVREGSTKAKAVMYLANAQEGASGRIHADAVCQNPSSCDWDAVIDVRDYEPGVYNLGLLLCYKNGSADEYRLYRFGDLQSFTVKDSEVIMPVTVSGME